MSVPEQMQVVNLRDLPLLLVQELVKWLWYWQKNVVTGPVDCGLDIIVCFLTNCTNIQHRVIIIIFGYSFLSPQLAGLYFLGTKPIILVLLWV